jgi:glycogen operon protein
LSDFAHRLSGSGDLYRLSGRGPRASVNFVTAHDGFTMCDLVSYNEKHNEANGENNQDGANDNESWNCGAEGDTDDATIRSARAKQQRNFLATLMLSQGVPMLLHGDELGRTQGGNNNAYCQDNEITWVDWNLDEERQALLSFAQQVIAIRKQHSLLRPSTFATGEPVDDSGLEDLAWFQADGQPVSDATWADANARSLGMRLAGREGALLVLVNAYWEDLEFVLPPADSSGARDWECLLDTDQPTSSETLAAGSRYSLRARSLALLSAA